MSTRCIKVLLVFALVLSGLAGCASPKEIQYRERGLVVDIKATADVNWFYKQPHTIALVFYQLSEPNIFNQMLEDPEGVSVLLEGQSFDASVKSRRKLVIQPGESRVLTMDRAADVRYVGVVAGFYNRREGNFSRLYPAKLWKFIVWAGPRKTKLTLRLGKDGFLN